MMVAEILTYQTRNEDHEEFKARIIYKGKRRYTSKCRSIPLLMAEVASLLEFWDKLPEEE